MSINPVEIPTGAVRFNTDSSKMEVYIGDTWMEVAVSSPNLDGGDRGIFATGVNGGNVIDFVTIASTGNATDFGDNYDVDYESASASSRWTSNGGAKTPRGPVQPMISALNGALPVEQHKRNTWLPFVVKHSKAWLPKGGVAARGANKLSSIR